LFYHWIFFTMSITYLFLANDKAGQGKTYMKPSCYYYLCLYPFFHHWISFTNLFNAKWCQWNARKKRKKEEQKRHLSFWRSWQFFLVPISCIEIGVLKQCFFLKKMFNVEL
jgi:hypothetical protein